MNANNYLEIISNQPHQGISTTQDHLRVGKCLPLWLGLLCGSSSRHKELWLRRGPQSVIHQEPWVLIIRFFLARFFPLDLLAYVPS